MRACKNILVVDDEAVIRMLLCQTLERNGFTAIEAASGDEAMLKARGCAQPIEALVSDIVMPGMSGPELARNIGAAQPGIKVILISGYCEHPPSMDPDWEFLQKPFSPATLCDALDRLLGASPASD
jgi:two-component system, cell cycle sensor histidine kinase and response regulator CckA